jgi:hypothetical protein
LQVKELELGQVIIQQSTSLGTLTPEAQRYCKFSSYAQQAELPVHNVPAGNWAKTPCARSQVFFSAGTFLLCAENNDVQSDIVSAAGLSHPLTEMFFDPTPTTRR